MNRSIRRPQRLALLACLFLAAPAMALDSQPELPLVLAQTGPADAQGRLQVDAETAERALERSLVRTGALLLPFGSAEIEPGFAYIRDERETPGIVVTDGLVSREFLGTDILEASLLLRVGLPADTQLEFGLPYRHVDEHQVTEIGFDPVASEDRTGTGVGDITIGVAKSLLVERAGRPNLVGRVTWDTDTGEKDAGGLPLGSSGFDELALSLSATKRQDPLVFTGDLLYERTLEEDDIRPGDRLGLSLGALLAASPDTSLRLTLDQSFVDAFMLDGVAVPGSDARIATFLIGASSIIGPGRFLDFSVQIGLTDAAPAYAAGISLAVRFDVFNRP